jgi:transketolase
MPCVTVREIEKTAAQMRKIQAEMSQAYQCYIGSSLSVTDILAVLYFSTMNVDASRPKDPKRDFLVLSKGHASPALYAALHLRGFVGKQELLQHSTVHSPVYFHPSMKVSGVELATGSLGQGLNFGVGVALAQRQQGFASRTFVILGDGELNEGSNWEAILSAHAFHLGNLVAIVDRNGWQANRRTEELVPLDDLAAKWQAFGWQTKTVDGHDVKQLAEAFAKPAQPQHAPLVVIANTTRGKGVSFLEDRRDRWLYQLSDEEFTLACDEIDGIAAAGQAVEAAEGFKGTE